MSDGSSIASSQMRSGEIKCSERLGTLRGEQFHAALNRFDCGDFVSAAPIPHGLFGQNVFVTSTSGQYVLRGKPHCLWQFPKERFFCNEIKRRTRVPVPSPYLIDPSIDIFGWSYVLMPRMPGKFIHDPEIMRTLTMEDRIAIAHAMGETLADLHRCTFDHCGEYDLHSDSIEPLTMPFRKWVLYHIRKSLDSCARFPDFNPHAEIEWFWTSIEALAPAMDVPFQPCAVMHDFKEGNANHDQVGGRWRVTGLFDLMEFFSGDGEMDLSRLACEYFSVSPKLTATFVKSYLAMRPTRPGFSERFRLYAAADRLTIWSYGIEHGWFQKGQTLRNWIEPSLDMESQF